MRTTIDKAGRLVVPKPLRDRVGMAPGPVDLVVDGVGIRIEPVSEDGLEEAANGRLVIPASGAMIDDDLVEALRDADRR
jgi:AbrB family looped-hinge helix DNA binding protein